VRQLEQLHPHLRAAPVLASPISTIGTPVDQLDVGTVLKAAQAGADRGLLILFQGDEPQTAAEATTGRGQINVMLRQSSVSPAEIPESVLQYVIRTRESVLLDDALAQNPSRQTSTSATSTPSRCFACLW
jgi:hypothetical protein